MQITGFKCSPQQKAYLFSNTGPETISLKDKEGATTTLLKVGKKETSRCTAALSAKKGTRTTMFPFDTKVTPMKLCILNS